MSDLATRIGEEDTPPEENQSLDLPDQPAEEIPQEEPQETFDVPIISLYNWYINQAEQVGDHPFTNIQLINFKVKGTLPGEYMVFKIPRPDLGTDEHGYPRVEVAMFVDACSYIVLNLPASNFQVYNNNTSRLIYDIGDGRFIKCYCVKTGLKLFFCRNMDGILIPYHFEKIKKDVKGVNYILDDPGDIQFRVTQPLDSEALQIRYRQIQKFIDKITTRQEALAWFQAKQNDVADINHLIQIDEVMMSIIE